MVVVGRIPGLKLADPQRRPSSLQSHHGSFRKQTRETCLLPCDRVGSWDHGLHRLRPVQSVAAPTRVPSRPSSHAHRPPLHASTVEASSLWLGCRAYLLRPVAVRALSLARPPLPVETIAIILDELFLTNLAEEREKLYARLPECCCVADETKDELDENRCGVDDGLWDCCWDPKEGQSTMHCCDMGIGRLRQVFALLEASVPMVRRLLQSTHPSANLSPCYAQISHVLSLFDLKLVCLPSLTLIPDDHEGPSFSPAIIGLPFEPKSFSISSAGLLSGTLSSFLHPETAAPDLRSILRVPTLQLSAPQLAAFARVIHDLQLWTWAQEETAVQLRGRSSDQDEPRISHWPRRRLVHDDEPHLLVVHSAWMGEVPQQDEEEGDT